MSDEVQTQIKEKSIGDQLRDVLFAISMEKVSASDDGVSARKWAILYTEVEKALAYYEYLLSKRSV